MAGKIAYKGTETSLAAALAGRYLMLLTAAPSGPGAALSSLAEYAATGYARVAVAFGAATGTPRTAPNSAEVSTPALTGANGTTAITHWAIVTVPTGTAGDLITYGTCTLNPSGAIVPAAGQAVKFAAGALTIAID